MYGAEKKYIINVMFITLIIFKLNLKNISTIIPMHLHIYLLKYIEDTNNVYIYSIPKIAEAWLCSMYTAPPPGIEARELSRAYERKHAHRRSEREPYHKTIF